VRSASRSAIQTGCLNLKHDGFRTVDYVEDGNCRLVSRNGNTFASFAGLAQSIADSINCQPVLLDGEIVCLMTAADRQFNELLFRRGERRFQVPAEER
jgi:ATP-dependent DNA ligase